MTYDVFGGTQSINQSAIELSRRLRSCMDRSTTAGNIHTACGHIPQSCEDTSLPALLPLTVLCLRSDFVIFGHFNRSCYYYYY